MWWWEGDICGIIFLVLKFGQNGFLLCQKWATPACNYPFTIFDYHVFFYQTKYNPQKEFNTR